MSPPRPYIKDGKWQQQKPITNLVRKQYGKGLIGTSACIAGIIPVMLDQGQYDMAKD